MCIVSMPAIKARAQRRFLNSGIGRTTRLTARFCSGLLPGSAPAFELRPRRPLTADRGGGVRLLLFESRRQSSQNRSMQTAMAGHTRMELSASKHWPRPRLALRYFGSTTLLALALTLTGCGGGGSDVGTFDISVVVAGQPTGGNYGPGNSPEVYVRAGQTIELDASESVYWTLYVAGTAVNGSGTTIHYAGADVTLTAQSSSRIAVDTYAAYRLPNSIPMTLVATSTFDSAIVSTVNVLITN